MNLVFQNLPVTRILDSLMEMKSNPVSVLCFQCSGSFWRTRISCRFIKQIVQKTIRNSFDKFWVALIVFYSPFKDVINRGQSLQEMKYDIQH